MFQDDASASASASTFDLLRAEGASTLGSNGGGGCDITFSGNAVATRSATATVTVTVTDGTVSGALGAQASFNAPGR